MSLIVEPTLARYLEFMIHGFYNGLITLRENLNNAETLSDEELETVYALGYYLFTNGKYKDAKEVFTGLTAYAPYTAFYWRALGAVNQQIKDYEEAVTAYDMAIANDPGDVVSYVYRSESKMLSGKKEEGLTELLKVIEIGGDNPQYLAWVQRARLLISLNKPELLISPKEQEEAEESEEESEEDSEEGEASD